jgi:hypothetical protein
MIPSIDPRINDKLVQFLRDLYKAWPTLQTIVKEFPRVRGKIDSLKGPGVSNTATTITINRPSDGGRPGPEPFNRAIPKGQYQYMVYQMTAQNVAGWDFVRAHPMLTAVS